MNTLDKVKVGETVRILRVGGEGILRKRIMEMGITKGSEIFVTNVAPLGDPMEIEIRGYILTIRKSDAEVVEVSASIATVPEVEND